MKKIFLLTILLLGLMLWPASFSRAQSPSPKLSPYEELRYGSDLSQVPREPYQTEFELEGYKARPYIPPEPETSVRAGASGRQRQPAASVTQSPLQTLNDGLNQTRKDGLKTPAGRVRDNYQNRATWRNEQRKISERSRIGVPSAPLTPGSPASLGRPGAPPQSIGPIGPTNRR